MITINDDFDMCLSGGADGADLQWGMCAGLLGHQVIHWSFGGHNSKAPHQELILLSNNQLEEANPAIEVVAKIVKKRPPKAPYIKRLIQRNYYQVRWCSSLYAVSTIKDGMVEGGTAWAVYMYLSRDDIKEKSCYVYDQTTDAWYVWSATDEVWCQIDSPPQPRGVWAGVGKRDLTEGGKNAIRELMEFKKPSGV